MLDAQLSSEETAANAEEEFWREADHEYEPPVHDPMYHEPMPTGPVRTVHYMPFDT